MSESALCPNASNLSNVSAPEAAREQSTVAQVIAEVCSRHGVHRIYGLPGGGSSLDVMQACAALDMPFILAHTEAAAGMMAAADAEANGGIAVVVTTQGPGTASVVNAIAHAALDRVPVLLITDGWTAQQSVHDSHQVFDQQALMKPLVKAHTRLQCEQVADELERLIALAMKEPWGPVYVELTGENARRKVVHQHVDPGHCVSIQHSVDETGLLAAKRLIGQARRPIVIVGLEARDPEVAQKVRAFVQQLRCPLLTTYKAKGTVPDAEAPMLGLFTGGALERESVGSADLIILCGIDPVELIGRPWGYHVPVLDLSPIDHAPHYVEPMLKLRLPLTDALDALSSVTPSTGWPVEEFATLKSSMRTRLGYEGQGEGLTPEQVVSIAATASTSHDPRIAVDAGAHMFSAMAFWNAKRPGDVLISNGLASMAFALPAGIALSLSDRSRQVMAFTGDGGLLMCIGELATAAREGVKLCVIVFNDSTLSLIQIKQQSRGLARDGIGWPRLDFAAIARGFGLEACSVATAQNYQAALERAFETQGPYLIDVQVDPSGYLAQSQALRG